MSRNAENLSRRDFFVCVPEHLCEQMHHELLQWADGDECRVVEFSTNSLGQIDSESSPRPYCHGHQSPTESR